MIVLHADGPVGEKSNMLLYVCGTLYPVLEDCCINLILNFEDFMLLFRGFE